MTDAADTILTGKPASKCDWPVILLIAVNLFPLHATIVAGSALIVAKIVLDIRAQRFLRDPVYRDHAEKTYLRDWAGNAKQTCKRIPAATTIEAKPGALTNGPSDKHRAQAKPQKPAIAKCLWP
jgi:hypothetical protein